MIVLKQLGLFPPKAGLELRRIGKAGKNLPARGERAQHLKAAMAAHYSAPGGFVGRSLIYEIWYDGVLYGHIAAGSATIHLPGRPPPPWSIQP